jgi:hypothetical protein
VGTSISLLNPDYVEFRDPIHGERYLAVPALHADWALIHVGKADVYGNGQHGGARFGDRLLARAAERVILTAEEIVPNEEIRENPFATSIPYADAVVEARFGSHPFASHGYYSEDEEALREYVDASRAYREGDMGRWEAYLDHWVRGPKNHTEYLRLLPPGRVARLEEAIRA